MFRNSTVNRSAFTLLELLLVMGCLAILLGIVVVSINPIKQIASAHGAESGSEARELNKAFYLFSIDIDNVSAPLPNVPVGKDNAIFICQYGVTDVSCANVDYLYDEGYLLGGDTDERLPVDPRETGAISTGYKVYVTEDGYPGIIIDYN